MDDQAFEADLSRLEDVLDDLEKVKRVHRGEKDVLFFALEYFGEEFNPSNDSNLIPKGVNYENSADFHKELCETLNDVSTRKNKKHIAQSTARGSAKSSYLTNIFATHQLVYRLRKFTVIVSQTTDSASVFLSWNSYQLKFNNKLINDFGRLLHERPSANELDNRNEFITTNDYKVTAKGLQTQLRGLRHKESRISLILVDDAESRDSTNTAELINKSKEWFKDDMMPALTEDGTVVYLGTILCYDSLLDYVIRERKDFSSRKYPAVIEWSERDDLWEEWRQIYREDRDDSVERAHEFYKDNEFEMTKGTEVLWEARWSYYDLMVIREDNGARSFASEYQGDVTDVERQLFKPEYFHYFSDRDIENMDLEYYCGVDAALGKEKGDFTAIVTGARNKATGVVYVVDVFMARVHPDIMIERVIELALKYQYEALGVEAVFALEYMADKLADELQNRGYPGHARVRKIKHRTRKELRIESMLPEIQSGRIRFHEKYRDGDEMLQFEMYGSGARQDDFPDATNMMYSTASMGEVVVRTTSKRMR